jgi:hypothetical protein
MSFNAIQQALDLHLIAVSGLPSDVQTENTQIAVTAGSAWVRSTLAPAENNDITTGIGGMVQKHGLYQIDLFYPINTGTMDARTMGDTICAAFARGTTLNNSGYQVIVEAAWQDTIDTFVDSQQIRLPVTVRWSCYV